MINTMIGTKEMLIEYTATTIIMFLSIDARLVVVHSTSEALGLSDILQIAQCASEAIDDKLTIAICR